MADLMVIGSSFGTAGTFKPLTAGISGAQRTQDAHARYADAALANRLYSISTAVAGVTVAAGHIIGAGTPLVGIYNPNGSNKTVLVNRVACSVNSGTPGAGGFCWGYMNAPSTTITTASGASEVNQGTFQAGGSGVRTYVATAVTGFVSVLLRHIGGPTAGAAAANGNLTVLEETGGSIAVPPGTALGVFAALAGTSPIVNVALEFEVVPLLAYV